MTNDELATILYGFDPPGSRVLVGDGADLFDSTIPAGQLDALWGAMILRPDLTFVLRTARPAEAAAYQRDMIDRGTRQHYMDPLMIVLDAVENAVGVEDKIRKAANDWYLTRCDQSGRGLCDLPVHWPLRNVEIVTISAEPTP